MCKCPSTKYDRGNFYGQFYEDYVLGYVFNHIQSGSYIDIGSNHPKINSVTNYFYQKGWRGISIDANPTFKELYEEERPDDIHLTAGIADQEGTLPFYIISDGPGFKTFNTARLSTFDKSISQIYEKNGFLVKPESIPVERLDNILKQYPMDDITFMSIDVAGLEKNVLQSIDFNTTKPAVFIIESTYPISRKPSYQDWEKILIKNGYVFAMSDALNRYYVEANNEKLLYKFNFINMCVINNKIKRDIGVNSIYPYHSVANKTNIVPLPIVLNKKYSFADPLHEKHIVALEGISDIESFGRWTDGNTAKLAFYFNQAKLHSYYTISFELSALITDENLTVASSVYLNKHLIGDVYFDETNVKQANSNKPYIRFDFKVPKHFFVNGQKNILTFKINGTVNPSYLGINTDTRKLGLSLYSMKVGKYSKNKNKHSS